MPISLVHVVEIPHQQIGSFTLTQLVTAFIANQIRVVTKPKEDSFCESYNGMFGSLIGRTNLDAYEKAVAFGDEENLTVDAGKYSYSVPSFDIKVTLAGKIDVVLKFLKLEDAELAYVELLTAASIAQEAQEHTESGA